MKEFCHIVDNSVLFSLRNEGSQWTLCQVVRTSLIYTTGRFIEFQLRSSLSRQFVANISLYYCKFERTDGENRSYG